MAWTEIRSEKALHEAMEQARGCYQRDLLQGYENLSGSTLRGRARDYSARYAESRANLLTRVKAAGVAVSERIGEHNKRILVIG